MKKLLLLILVLASFTVSQTTQPASKPLVDIREVMSASEFTKAGLQKLSSEEIAALNAWLSRYSVRLMASASVESTSTAPVIESYIDGDFEGWSGETVLAGQWTNLAASFVRLHVLLCLSPKSSDL